VNYTQEIRPVKVSNDRKALGGISRFAIDNTLAGFLFILSIREWTCESCGENHDRDVNAAKNILKQGINILSGCGMQSDTKQKHSEALPLGESMTYEAQPIASGVGG